MLKNRLTLVTVLFLIAASALLYFTCHAQLEADLASVEDGSATSPAGILSLSALKPAEQYVVRFLLMLPVGALIVSLCRTLIGVPMFGSFAPVLLGLAFMNLNIIAGSLLIFSLTVLVGWKLRWLLDRLRLLQVSRFSALLTLIITFLIVLIRLSSHYGLAAAECISLFPLAILTHTAERFWTMETEDGKGPAFRSLVGTMVVAVCVAGILSIQAVIDWLFHYPEALGLVLAAHLMLGRYTGYRLSELYRFNDLLNPPFNSLATIPAPAESLTMNETSDGFAVFADGAGV
jgi:hypothetical protein